MTKNNELSVQDYARYLDIGMKNITSEDIRPPVAFLVQGIKDKSELVDASGRECPDGSFFVKGTNEVFKKMEVYFVWVKKDHYQIKAEDNRTDKRWDGSRMFRAIAIRSDEMTPFAINFVKSSLGALNDLLTAKTTKNYPLFVFKCELTSVLVTNKSGDKYFKAMVTVKGIENKKEILNKLFAMAKGFDIQQEVKTQDDEPEEPAMDVTPITEAPEPQKEADIDDVGEWNPEEDEDGDVPF